MRIKFPYGNGFVQTEIPRELLEVAFSKQSGSVRAVDESVKQSLARPIASKPLASLGGGKRVCVIVPDKTRACPTRRILPLVLDELATCQPIELKILIGCGLHAAISENEAIEFLDESIVEQYEVLNHVAVDESQLVDSGKRTSYGTPCIVNQTVAESDYVIGIGLVEPHLFAGFSGGRKTLLPAVAGKWAIFNNHSYNMIAHPNASYGILAGNPIHADMVEFMNFSKLSFVVNVTLDDKGEVSGIFTGHPVQAHTKAARFLNRYINIKLRRPADIVIVSNGGYPLDRDMYQLVKGMAVARRVARSGGVIIVIAQCKDGSGGHAGFMSLMQESESPEDVLSKIRANEPIIDQWQAQILATILSNVKVVVITEKVNHGPIREMMMEPVSTLEEALDLAREMLSNKQPRIAAIPEGPYVIPSVKSGSP